MKTLGAKYNDAEYASFMDVWRYSGYLMGIPETILFHDATDALKLYDVGIVCEPSSESTLKLKIMQSHTGKWLIIVYCWGGRGDVGGWR